MADLAVDTTDGVATMRAGLDLHQQTQASLGAGRIAAGEITDVNSFLREAIADAARLEAYFIEHAGHRAEANERRVDDVIGRWIDLAVVLDRCGQRPVPAPWRLDRATLGACRGRVPRPRRGHRARPVHDP